MNTFVTIIHIATCVFLVLFVLVQSGKGAEISASFAGSSQTVFGSSGGANFFQKATGLLAAIFFTTSVVLTVLANQSRRSIFEGQPAAPAAATAPVQAVPAAGTATTTAAPADAANAPAAAAPAAPAAAPGSTEKK